MLIIGCTVLAVQTPKLRRILVISQKVGTLEIKRILRIENGEVGNFRRNQGNFRFQGAFANGKVGNIPSSRS